MTDPVKKFWDEQAETHGTADTATNPDSHYRELEIRELGDAIAQDDHDDILDVGCGNGYSTLELARRFPDSDFVGVDYSEDMISQAVAAAKAAKIDNVRFIVGDVLSLSRTPELAKVEFDVVTATRCLINLANWPEQKLGILEMRKVCRPNGRLILVENTQEGLANLNSVRKKLGLDPIEVRWHNFYIPQAELMKFLLETKGHLFVTENVTNIGNMYYLISRVVYAALAKKEGKEPEYSNPINEIASKMPTLGDFYACSPNFLFVLRNVAEQGAMKSWESKKKPS